MPMPVQDVNARFDAKVRVAGPDECWEWTASTQKGGYGSFRMRRDGRRVIATASRFAYERANGPIPQGMFVLHRCDNPRCVNPAHLFAGTVKDNMRDCVAKGRFPYQRLRPTPTECVRGHDLDAKNTYINPRGYRECRACRNAAARRRDDRKRGRSHGH